MKWQGYRRSTNVSDKRGMGGMAMGGGLGAVVLAVVAMLLGVNPADVLPPATQQEGAPPPSDDSASQFVQAVLTSTEDMWNEGFAQSNQDYPDPQLNIFSGVVQSACGMAQSAMGPFYCPRD